MKRTVIGCITISVCVGLWQLYANAIDNHYILPPPMQVGQRLIELLRTPQTYHIIVASIRRLMVSISFAMIPGIFFGLLAGRMTTIDYALRPLVTTLRTLPVASVIVIVMILVGSPITLYVIAFLMLFPLVYEASKQGVLSIDTSINEALSLESSKRFAFMYSIDLPLAFPYIKTAFLQSFGLGFKVLVMAEFITQAPSSIGRALYDGTISIYYDTVFAWTLILIVIVTIIENGFHRLKSNLK